MMGSVSKEVSGTTRLYGLVGDPLHAARSPQLFNSLFAKQNSDAVCIPFSVKAGNLDSFVGGLRTVNNLDGLFVTMPHKARMIDLVDEIDVTARQANVLNIVRCTDEGRWIGATFDGCGCVLGMQWEGNDPTGRSVLLVGAGGAGRAIAFAIAAAGARALTIFDADELLGQRLAEAVAVAADCDTRFGPSDPSGFDIVINATPLGMKPGDAMPIDPARLSPHATVVDIILKPDPTPLCEAARSRGCRVQGGRPMHDGQAVYAARFLGFDYWPEGRTPPMYDPWLLLRRNSGDIA
jgi:shikimate dehydrogenase